MRVDRQSSDDAGVAALIVAVSLVVLVGMAGLAVDVGNVWQTRRHMVTATDAAALAAAEVYATGGNGCSSTAGSYLSSNFAEAVMTGCTVNKSGSQGAVTVSGTRHLSLLFAPAVSAFTSTDVKSSTTVKYGAPSGLSGLRPFGLCIKAPVFAQWTDRTHGFGPMEVPYGKNSATDCGQAAGNWGILDFDGGSNSSNDTKDWVEKGYPNVVTAPSTIDGDPGAFSNSLDGSITSIIGQRVTLPIFDNSNQHGGNKADFHVIGFANVIIRAFKTNGAAANRSLTIEFVTGIVQGTCCSNPPIDTGLRVVQICAVDPNTNCS